MIITEKCKIDNCDGMGSLSKSGKRNLTRGYCKKHYSRYIKGNSLTDSTIHDKRPAIVEGNIAKIPIGLNAKEGYAIVDGEFAWLDKYNWYIGGNIKSERIKSRDNGKIIKLHHMIVGKAPKGFVVDHKDRDIFNNRKNNLRFVTKQINMINKKLSKANSTGYKGVSYSKERNNYRASLEVKGKVYSYH